MFKYVVTLDTGESFEIFSYKGWIAVSNKAVYIVRSEYGSAVIISIVREDV